METFGLIVFHLYVLPLLSILTLLFLFGKDGVLGVFAGSSPVDAVVVIFVPVVNIYFIGVFLVVLSKTGLHSQSRVGKLLKKERKQ